MKNLLLFLLFPIPIVAQPDFNELSFTFIDENDCVCSYQLKDSIPSQNTMFIEWFYTTSTTRFDTIITQPYLPFKTTDNDFIFDTIRYEVRPEGVFLMPIQVTLDSIILCNQFFHQLIHTIVIKKLKPEVLHRPNKDYSQPTERRIALLRYEVLAVRHQPILWGNGDGKIRHPKNKVFTIYTGNWSDWEVIPVN